MNTDLEKPPLSFSVKIEKPDSVGADRLFKKGRQVSR
jgi:hypothetical protein